MQEDTDLDRLAEAELLLEAKRGLARSNVFGPTGWKRCPLPGANKKFLQNTIMNAVSSNKLKEQNLRIKCNRDYLSHKRDHKLKRSESLKEHGEGKEDDKCDRSEKVLHMKLKYKDSNNLCKHMDGHSLPERIKESAK